MIRKPPFWLVTASFFTSYGPSLHLTRARQTGLPFEKRTRPAIAGPPSLSGENFSVPENANVKIEVYNITGKLINTLVNNYITAGSYTVNWNGRDQNSNVVGSGIYFYRLSSSDLNITRKMILLR